MITRRQILVSGLAGAAAGLSPLRLWAETTLEMGQARLTTLSDGFLQLPESFVFGDLDREAAREVLAAMQMTDTALQPPCNVTLLRRDDAVILFDAGSGPAFMDSAGKLPEALDAAGLAPEDITHVVFTHAHPDHLWGAVDDFDEPTFPEARYLMGDREHAFWTDPAVLDNLAPDRQSFAAGAARRLEILGDRVETFGDGDELLPGLRAMLTPGHTPGHMSFELSSGDVTALVVGDAIGNGHLALARPDWDAPADQDPALGAQTRVALLNRIAEADMPIVGFHLPGGGLGRVARSGDAFAFTPAG